MRASSEPAKPLPMIATSHRCIAPLRRARKAVHRRPGAARHVEPTHAIDALRATLLARRETIRIPEIAGDDGGPETRTSIECGLELRQGRWRELPDRCETL